MLVSDLASCHSAQVLDCVFKLVDLYDVSLGLKEYQDLLSIQYPASNKLQTSHNIQKIKMVKMV